jgi:glucokinase
MSPVFYMTIGSGIGGGLIVDGKIMRGTGRGAAEIGHFKVRDPRSEVGKLESLENVASGWAIGRHAHEIFEKDATAEHVARAAAKGDPRALHILGEAIDALADAICAVIVLICPRRVVIGGGVSLIGEELLFSPLRKRIAERVFPPFAGLTEIEPAALGEAVVVQGALALARRRIGG